MKNFPAELRHQKLQALVGKAWLLNARFDVWRESLQDLVWDTGVWRNDFSFGETSVKILQST